MSAVTPPAVANQPARPRLSWRVDAVTMALSGWLLAGVVADAWAHNTLATLETFFTPWHAVFYSGSAATAGWLLATAARTRTAGRGGLAALPAGYGLAVVGVAAFAAGGIGDLAWHTIFGIEQDVEAVFSPTHLLLFVGMVLMVSTPLRAAWSDPAERLAAGSRRLVPVLASVTLVTVLVAFMFAYWAAFTHLVGAIPGSDLLLLDGVATVLASNLLLLAPLLGLARRWRLPVGTATTIYTSVAVLLGAASGFPHPALLAAALLAGLLVDGLLWVLGPAAGRPRRFWAVGALVPLATWGVYFAVVAVTAGIGWSPELWTGTIVWACLLGLALSLLMLPPPVASATPPSQG